MNKIIPFIIIFIFCLCSSCTFLFYHPDSLLYGHPHQLGIKSDSLFFSSSQNSSPKLHGLYLHHSKNIHPFSSHLKKDASSQGLILFFHGNAQNVSSHFYHLAWLTQHFFDIFLFDYRGYGQSEGSPDPKDIQNDAKSFIEKGIELYQTHQLKGPLVIYGHSLGGIIALDAIYDQHLQKKLLPYRPIIFIEGSFSSYHLMAKEKLKQAGVLQILSPLVPLLISNETAPPLSQSSLPFPVFVLHGEEDSIVPLSQGTLLFHSLSSNIHKEFWSIPHGEHHNIFHQHLNNQHLNEWRQKLISSLRSFYY